MRVSAQLFASEALAAKLLDLKPAQFRKLVASGLLPHPCRLGDFERWDVEQLRAIAGGEVVEGMGGIDW